MIELGKYFSTFIVTRDMVKGKHIEKRLICNCLNRECVIQYIYGDSIGLTLLTNDQEDCISINNYKDI